MAHKDVLIFQIADLGEDWSMKNHADAPNILLMETLFQQLKNLHDRELFLSPFESKQFVDLIFKRHRNFQQRPVPFPRRDSCGMYLILVVRLFL